MTLGDSRDYRTVIRHLGAMMSEGFLKLDKNGTISLVNEEFSLLIGASDSELEGYSIYDYLDGANKKQFQSMIEGLENTEQISSEIIWGQNLSEQIPTIVTAKALNQKVPEIFCVVSYIPSISDLVDDNTTDQSFEELLEMSPDGIAVVSWTGRVIYVNKVMIDQTGSSKEDVIGKRFTKLQALRARDIPRFLKIFSRAIRGKMPELFEVFWYDESGTERCSEVRVSAVRKDGKFVGLMSIARDITERKKTEEDLQNSKRYQEIIMDTIPDAVIFVDTDSKIAMCNKSVERILGYTQDELIGRNYTVIIPEVQTRDSEQRSRELELHQVGYLHNEDFLMKKKDGSIINVSYTVAILKDEDDTPLGMVGTVRDISDRLKVHATLVESENKYRTLYETMTDGVVYQDKDGAIINANPAAERILGLSVDQLMGRKSIDPRWRTINPDGSTISGEDHPAMKALRTGLPVRHVSMGVYNPTSENYRWISVNAIPLFKPEETEPFLVYTTFNDFTEKKESDERIRKSEERYRQLFDLAPVGIGLSHKNGEIIDFNNHLCDMLGLYPDDSKIQVEDFYVDSQDRQELLHDLERDGIIRNREIRQRRRDGSIIWVLLNIDEVEFQGEQVNFTTIRDITKLKEANLALQESESNFRALFENTPNVLAFQEVIVDETGIPIDFIFLQVNDAFLSYSNLSREDVLGKKVTEVYPGVETAQRDWIQTMGNVALSGEPFRMDSFMEQYNRWFKVLAFSPKKNQFVTVFADIHDMKLAEASLREEKERAETYLDIAGVMFLALDKSGNVTMINKMGCEILGYNSESIIGHNWFDEFLSENIASEMKEVFSEIIEGESEGVESYVNQILTRTGEKRTIEWRNTALRNDEGEIIGIISSGSDITEKVNSQQRIQTERDRAMLYLDLMSHDIRNKLQAIIGSAELILQETESSFVEEMSKVILSAGEKCASMISKIKKTELLTSVKLEPIQLNSVLLDTIVDFNRSYPHVAIYMNRSLLEAHIRADEFLDDMLYTLLENAAAHNHGEEKKIWVRIYDEDGGYSIVISDNGSGLSEDQKEVLFDMKKRIAGVGLHQVRHIIEKYRGQITVSDRIQGKPTAGAEFRVWIPKA